MKGKRRRAGQYKRKKTKIQKATLKKKYNNEPMKKDKYTTKHRNDKRSK